MRTPTTPARRLAIAIRLGIAAGTLAGCRAVGPPPTPPPRPIDGPALPIVRTPDSVNGVEVRSWTIDPLGAPVARALAAYEVGLASPAGGLRVADTQPWREQGFRLVEIPVELAAQLEATLPHVDAVRRVWLGQPTRWSDLATRALPSDGGALGGRPVPVRATLAVRSWIEPGVRRRPIRLELALTGVPLDGTDSRPIVLRDLLLTHRLESGVALAIVPAPPDEVWLPGDGALPDPTAPPETAGPDAPDETPARTPHGELGVATLDPPGSTPGAPAPEPQAGPVLPLPTSLGESMLMDAGRIRSTPPRASREVLVIIPSAR